MKNKLIVVALAMVSFVGCEKKEKTEVELFAEQPVQSVSWYKEHAPEREKVLKLCADNIGQLKENANCVNASAVVASAFESNERIETPKALTFEKTRN